MPRGRGRISRRIPRRRIQRRNTRRRRFMQHGGDANAVISKQIQSFLTSDHPGIYYVPNESNLREGYAMIIGPRIAEQLHVDEVNAKYPFEHCLFFFKVTFPETYPARPPKFKFLNSSIEASKNLRIHPNLYEYYGNGEIDGKVCLGVLGTFGRSEWRPNITLTQLLSMIQNILYDNPVDMEPAHNPSELERISYNHIAQHTCINVSRSVFQKIWLSYSMLSSRGKVERPAANGIAAVSQEEEQKAVTDLSNSILDDFIKPFYFDLKQLLWSSLSFYESKLSATIPAYKVMPSVTIHHNRSKIILDYRDLLTMLRNTIPRIPAGLQNPIPPAMQFGPREAGYDIAEEWDIDPAPPEEEAEKKIADAELADKIANAAEMGAAAPPNGAAFAHHGIGIGAAPAPIGGFGVLPFGGFGAAAPAPIGGFGAAALGNYYHNSNSN